MTQVYKAPKNKILKRFSRDPAKRLSLIFWGVKTFINLLKWNAFIWIQGLFYIK